MSFTPRTTDAGIRTSPYYFGNYNPFYESGWGMPNCTAYSFGRFAESGNLDYTDYSTRPTLSRGNADSWFANTGDGYQRGQTPQLGAVICFSGGIYSGDGHVAVVEEIYQDGSILVSESGYNAYFFRTSVRTPGGAYPYSDATDQYIFQGFIYNPYITGGPPPEPASWISGNRFLDRAEMDNNAIKFYYSMTRQGASYNAILSMLANIEAESTINPGIWESLDPYGGGYGLVQWTPYTKYSDWAGTGWENNGQKECERIIYEAQNDLQWFANPYAPQVGYPVDPPVTFNQFISSNLDPKTLADYWLLYYEHPAEQYIAGRISDHQAKVSYYNQLLNGGGPVSLPKKAWLYYQMIRRLRRKNGSSILRVHKYI